MQSKKLQNAMCLIPTSRIKNELCFRYYLHSFEFCVYCQQSSCVRVRYKYIKKQLLSNTFEVKTFHLPYLLNVLFFSNSFVQASFFTFVLMIAFKISKHDMLVGFFLTQLSS